MEQQVEQKRLTANDFHPEVLKLFDRYVHGMIDRRGFLDGAAKFAVGGITAAAILQALSPNYALAEQVPESDKRIATMTLDYDSPKGQGKMKGYFARPANLNGKIPGVLVVHENRGLTPYIKDVARRLAVANFVAFAPDALTPLGGYPGNDDKGVEMQRTLDQNKIIEDFIEAVSVLQKRPECTGKVGAVGFCFGGSVVNQLAVRVPSLGAAAPYYGGQPKAEDVAKINAPLMIHYGALDERVDAGWPDFEKALKANNKKYEEFMYAGANHGFHNDTTPRYDKAAAELSWQRTIDFFNKNLRTGGRATN
jgi:carboxymethylenebutenolidase